MAIKATARPARTLLSPQDHALILIDHQSQMAFDVRSIDPTNLRINVGSLAQTARGFNVPTILSTISKDTFAGPLFPEIAETFPDAEGPGGRCPGAAAPGFGARCPRGRAHRPAASGPAVRGADRGGPE